MFETSMHTQILLKPQNTNSNQNAMRPALNKSTSLKKTQIHVKKHARHAMCAHVDTVVYLSFIHLSIRHFSASSSGSPSVWNLWLLLLYELIRFRLRWTFLLRKLVRFHSAG